MTLRQSAQSLKASLNSRRFWFLDPVTRIMADKVREQSVPRSKDMVRCQWVRGNTQSSSLELVGAVSSRRCSFRVTVSLFSTAYSPEYGS